MTEHLLPADTKEDQRIMRQLAIVVGCFVVFTAAMAIGVSVTLG